MDHSTPGASVHGILQARILEWVSKPPSRTDAMVGMANDIEMLINLGWYTHP